MIRRGRLSSVDVLDEAEHARLDGFGHRAVLAQPVTAKSIPAVFAEQVVRAPGGSGVCLWWAFVVLSGVG